MISPNPYFERQQVLILSGISGTVCAVHRLRICCPFPNRFCVASSPPLHRSHSSPRLHRQRNDESQLSYRFGSESRNPLGFVFKYLTLWPWHAFAGTVSYRRFCNLSLLVLSYGLKILGFDANI